MKKISKKPICGRTCTTVTVMDPIYGPLVCLREKGHPGKCGAWGYPTEQQKPNHPLHRDEY